MGKQTSQNDTSAEKRSKPGAAKAKASAADAKGPKKTKKELPMLAGPSVLFPHLVMPATLAEPIVRYFGDGEAFENSEVVVAGLVEGEKLDRDKSIYEQVFPVVTVATVLKTLRSPDGQHRALLHGLRRARLKSVRRRKSVPFARLEDFVEVPGDEAEAEAARRLALQALEKIVEIGPLPAELLQAARQIDDHGRLADMIVSNLDLRAKQMMEVLGESDPAERLKAVHRFLLREERVLEVGNAIQSKAREEIEKTQREFYLREQAKHIREELGDDGGVPDEMDELRERLQAKEMPEKPRQVAERELARLGRVNPASPEHAVARAYVDWLLSMPWSEEAETNLDIPRAREVLDEDHYDLEEVKDRILEYLAALKLSGGRRATILCLVGPPGAGKTSLGRSVAKALNRPFHRFSLGGMRDEAEIRGHRRTYIGAMPGRLIKAVRNAGVINPVIVLDEVDKIGSDFRGDPASALLEALDPEQNSSFVDNYLDTPYDLSKVLFITTANSLDPIPGPLLDRMEVIRLGGYTLEQKVEIAKRHLIGRQLRDNGLEKSGVKFADSALRTMIEEHTREAGLRQLERVIGRVCRKIARKVAEGGEAPGRVLQRDLETYLDAPPFQAGPPKRPWRPGIATALAWTPTGGEILHIEANLVEPGQGRLRLTGQLGDVMKESASAALSFLRSRSKELGIPEEAFTQRDLHAHIPAGAIPKDGPSAGLAMASAFASEMLGVPVDRFLAMTGEITLKGVALPVGGVKEKALAAARAGMKRLVLPERNRRDLEKVPDSIREKMEFFFVENADEALALAIPKLGKKKASAAKKRTASRKNKLKK